MRPSTSARRYAEAAFDVARKDGDMEGWLQDLRIAAEAVTEPSADAFFKDPNSSTTQKIETLKQIVPSVRPHVLNLLLLLVTRHRLALMPGILQEFERLEHEAQGVTEADVTVARPMSDSEARDVGEHLGRATGGRKVNLRVHVDPSVLGGIVIRIGDQLIDASVRGRLERLRQEIAV
ncbi:MAG TPA: ATP synthase F1 subunit delta [Chloroflexota bacterium]